MSSEKMTALDHPNTLVGYYEQLPPSVIEEIALNQIMRDNITDPRLRLWLDEDFLLSYATLFAIGKKEGHRRPQPHTMHRGVVFKLLQESRPFIDEFGVCFGEIGAKGTGMTVNGENFYRSNQTEPLGFFGRADALQEQEISDKFAELGGRGGRVLAIISINHKNFLEWFEEKDKGDSFYEAASMLKKVENNGDQAAICVRLLGTERIEDLWRASFSGDGLFSVARQLQRAASLLSFEITNRSREGFLDYYQLEGKGRSIEEHLLEIASGKPNRENLITLYFLQLYFINYNYRIEQLLSERNYGGQLTHPGNFQNFDSAGFIYDWETSLPASGYIPNDAALPGLGDILSIVYKTTYGLDDIDAQIEKLVKSDQVGIG